MITWGQSPLGIAIEKLIIVADQHSEQLPVGEQPRCVLPSSEAKLIIDFMDRIAIALEKIGPWIAASVDEESCQEYASAAEEIMKLDQEINAQ